MRFLATLLLGTSLLSAVGADAQVPTQPMQVEWRGGRPVISFDAGSMVDDHVRREVQSGLRRTVVFRVYAYEGGGSRPVALEQVSIRMTYDLWDDQYRIERQTSVTRSEEVAPTLEEALRRSFQVRDLVVGAAGDYQRVAGRELHFAVLAEFNPVSRSTVDRVRQLIARGGQLTDERVIGSFVSLFVNRRIGAADRVFRFRSRLFRVPQ